MVGRPVVLVVDDADGVRDCLVEVLASAYDVVTASSGLEALAVVDARPVDLLLLDVLMPGLDGIETLRRLRSSRSDLPVVLLTAHDSARAAVTALKLGAHDYLMKPLAYDDLLTVARQALGAASTVAPSGVPREIVVSHIGTSVGARAARAALLASVPGIRAEPGVAPADLVVDDAGALDAICARIHETCPAVAAGLPPFGPVVERVMDLAARSYASMTVEDLASGMPWSPRHLSRRFGKDAGMTLREYLGRVRTEASKCLLVETTSSVEAIGADVGFYDASHFARVFRLYAGMSPGEYRRRRAMSEISRSMSDVSIVERATALSRCRS